MVGGRGGKRKDFSVSAIQQKEGEQQGQTASHNEFCFQSIKKTAGRQDLCTGDG